MWYGRFGKGQILQVAGESASFGKVHGTLPGYSVSVEARPSTIKLVREPRSDSCWQSVEFRNDGQLIDEFQIVWKAR